MKRLIAFYSLLILAASVFAADSPRIKYNFNPGWKLFRGDAKGAEAPAFNDASWEAITLPHAWNEDSAFKVAIDKHPTGIVWYRKKFRLPASDMGKKIFLEFEGVRQAGEFYLNGKQIGLHENGAMAFGFDITNLVKAGDNVIAVRIDNDWAYKEKATDTKFQWSDKNFNANYGGLPKNVWLHVADKLYQTLPLYSFLQTTGVYVYPKEFDIPNKTATIVAESEVRNEHSSAKTFQYEVEIKDLDGKIVKVYNGGQTTIQPGETKTVSASSRINNLNFWSWGYGYLYTVSTRLKINGKPVDEVQTQTGFRKAEFKNGMVYLNDRVLLMKGYAQRTSNEWPALGMSVPPWLSDYSNGLMVESNANLVRWMHITPWKQDVESCDRVGLIQAMPAGDAENDARGVQWTQRTQLMRDAIIYNRNNPSILFYECGNEAISEEHMAEMKAIRDKYDPHGWKAIGSREMLDSKVAEWGGEMLYTNKSADIPMWATEYSRDEGLRKYWDEFSPPFHKNGEGPLYNGQNASSYNRNQDTHALESVARWYEFWRERPGTGDRVSAGGVNIIFSDSNTHYRGAENYRRSGEVDPMRIAKDGFYAHKVMWDGWVDPERHSTHIIGHWNYQPGTKKNVYAVSTGEKVELFINDKSKGFGERRDGFAFTFRDIEWQSGTIKAVAYDAQNKKLSEAEIKTAGAPASLRLTTMQAPRGLKADAADVVLAQIEVVDAQGNRCPTALNMINFRLEGPAEWRGGIAQGPDNYILSKSLPVEGGVNRVLIRSTTKAGQIVLSATSDSLKSATIAFKSVPVKVTNGLSLDMPYAGLSPSLKRGPTPEGPSFTPSRKAIKIITATAGSDAEKVSASFDDNELTNWANDGQLSTAWIKYELANEAVVDEVTLKVNNFRSASYPIKILVDGQEVFSGRTPRSLGYGTIPVKSTKGKTVTIQLTGSTSVNTNANAGVEVGGQKLEEGVVTANPNARGTLNIIETEIYTKIK
ncbi:sugar-binding domain-containing protein [Paradesertivirga mongoliensis]|uniref:Sugar-binding domain-containing protein n=1 Tax=Paradesertivirga mongoliensis TaxID=2100740 RepID=A0ABW4ZJZ9_9SPHI|nr:sugar-binding domain-containing protein [Pedobacter mongoliensis]